MYKKLVLLAILAVAMASCGTQKKAVTSTKTSGTQKEILDYGMKYMGKPYRYAAKGPNAFDCSGFTSFVFREFGINLSPSSAGQDQQVPSVRRKEDLQPGDLVFFEGRSIVGRVGHVGIVKELLPNGEFTFLHAATGSGVIVSRSSESYYAARFLRGGRVLSGNNLTAMAKKAPEKNIKPSKTNNKQKRAFVQAKAKKPAVIAAPKTQTEKEMEIVMAQNTVTTPQQEAKNDTTIIHTRPVDVPLPDTTNKNNENDESIAQLTLQAMTRVDTISIPEPKESKIVSTDTLSHQIKPGETLYSISRKYNCTVDELRQWNPQLGNVLKSGEKLIIRP